MWSWDWTNFLPTIVAVFIAFSLTVLASVWRYRFSKTREKKDIVYGIIQELRDIKTQFNDINFAEGLQITPIKTPFWHSAISGARLSPIINESWFCSVAKVHAKVDEINAWFRMTTEHYIEAQISDTARKEQIESIVERIKSKLKSEEKSEKKDNGKLFKLIDDAESEINVALHGFWKRFFRILLI
jgi:hypothetical protein